MATAIDKHAQYTLKPSAVRGRRYTRVIPSISANASTGVSMGSTLIFNLPCGLANQVMDGSTAYLRFTLLYNVAAGGGGNVAANAQSVAFDYTASSIINRIDIYGSGGALIESISRYNVLANILYDVQYSQSDLKGLSALIGCAQGDTTNATNRLGVTFPNTAQVNSNTNTTFSAVVAVPLISSIFALAERYTPIYALNDDIRAEIVLDTQATAFVIPTVANSTVTCSIASPEIVVDYIEMEPTAMESIKSLYAGQDLVIASTSYRNFSTTVSAGTAGSWNTILPAKPMSAKNALITFRDLADISAQDQYTLSVRTNPFTGATSSFNLNCGGQRVPQRPITVSRASDITEFFAELSKSFHSLGAVEYSTCLLRTCYTSTDNVAANDVPANRGFVIGVNLDTLHRNSELLLSGLDLSKVTSYLEASFATAISGQQTIDTFIHHDMLLIVDANGNLVSKF